MNVFLEILRYILAVALALAICIIYICYIALSTVLSEGYVVSKASQTNYYRKIYEDFNNNFAKYILQSGLEKDILNDVCSMEKIEQDTNYIFENIYFGKNNDIETDSIKNKLNDNINKYIYGKDITIESRESIDQFVDIICNEYIDTIMHTKYETKINSYIVKAQYFTKKINQYGKFAVIGIIILIFLVDIKKINRNISVAGMSFLFLGIIFVYGRNLLLKNLDIGNIFIISDAFSDIVKLIVNENLASISVNANRFIILGIILIFFGNMLQVEKKKKHRKNRKLYLSDISK